MAKTKAEKLHYQKLVDIGCIVCLQQGHGYVEPHIHHTRFNAGMGMKSDWVQSIPLCPMHHQHGGYGVAFHAGKEAFEENFGTEEELLDAVTHCLRNR